MSKSRIAESNTGEGVDSPLNGRQPLYAKVGYCDLQTLEGRLLTLADASFSDVQQRKAFKDILQSTFWYGWVEYLDRPGDSGPVGIPNKGGR
jgi:hypothetical protein